MLPTLLLKQLHLCSERYLTNRQCPNCLPKFLQGPWCYVSSDPFLVAALPENYLSCISPTWLDMSLLFPPYSCKSEKGTLHILSMITFNIMFSSMAIVVLKYGNRDSSMILLHWNRFSSVLPNFPKVAPLNVFLKIVGHGTATT